MVAVNVLCLKLIIYLLSLSINIIFQFCFSSVANSCLTLCNPKDCSIPGFLSFTISWSLLRVMPCNSLILCCPLLLPSIFPSIRVFSSELALNIRWPKYWSFSFSISPSNEYWGLISFMIDWLIALQSKGFSRVFSSAMVRKHHFFHPRSLWSSSHICTWLLEKP